MPRGVPLSSDDLAFVRRMIKDYNLTRAAKAIGIPITTLKNMDAGQDVRRGTLIEFRAKRKLYERKNGKLNAKE